MVKTNKRVLALVLAAVMLASLMLTGCGRVKDDPSINTRPVDTRPTRPNSDNRNNDRDDRDDGKDRNDEMSKTELAAYCETRVVRVNVSGDGFSGHGTGFFIDNNGTLVTNYHVIEGADNISIQFDNGANYAVNTIVDFSPYYDVAVLKADVTDTDCFTLGSGADKGEDIYISGYPKEATESRFDEGTINSASQMMGLMDCYVISATINAGNSGGPMFNSRGEVLGINTMHRTDAQNMNYAVNISAVEDLKMDKNYTISRYREWYNKEIGRSYYQLYNNTFSPTYIHTYTIVTEAECLRSMNSNKDYRMGYSIGYVQYAYEYNVKKYDEYVDYLYSVGFEYVDAFRDRGEDITRYVNYWEGYYIDLEIDTVNNVLYVYCPTY